MEGLVSDCDGVYDVELPKNLGEKQTGLWLAVWTE